VYFECVWLLYRRFFDCFSVICNKTFYKVYTLFSHTHLTTLSQLLAVGGVTHSVSCCFSPGKRLIPFTRRHTSSSPTGESHTTMGSIARSLFFSYTSLFCIFFHCNSIFLYNIFSYEPPIWVATANNFAVNKKIVRHVKDATWCILGHIIFRKKQNCIIWLTPHGYFDFAVYKPAGPRTSTVRPWTRLMALAPNVHAPSNFVSCDRRAAGFDTKWLSRWLIKTSAQFGIVNE